MAFDFLGGCPNCDSLWLPPRAAYLIALSWRDSPPPLRLLAGPRLSSSPQLRATALGLVIECGCCQVAVNQRHRPRMGARLEFRFGSGPGIRTLNLAVNRSLRPVQKWRPEFAEYR